MTALDEEEVDQTAVREAADASGPANRGGTGGTDRVERDAAGRSAKGGDGSSMADTDHQHAEREPDQRAQQRPGERPEARSTDAASAGLGADGSVDGASAAEEDPDVGREFDRGAGSEADPGAVTKPGAPEASPEDPEASPEGMPEAAPRPGMTPRQARRVRVVTSGVVMAAVAAALVIRLGNAPSLLVVGLYGIALILSGVAIVLSRRGRTRVATAVLGCGFVMVILAERMLPDGS